MHVNQDTDVKSAVRKINKQMMLSDVELKKKQYMHVKKLSKDGAYIFE